MCKHNGIVKQYHGESVRSSYLRQWEHWRAYLRKSKDSVMWKHVMSEHRQEEEQVVVDAEFDVLLTQNLNNKL